MWQLSVHESEQKVKKICGDLKYIPLGGGAAHIKLYQWADGPNKPSTGHMREQTAGRSAAYKGKKVAYN